jgi:restriction system protein
MIIIWSVLAIARVLLFLLALPTISLFVHEPLNTIAFFSTGTVLIVLKIVRTIEHRRDIQQKADAARNVEDLLNLSPKAFEEMVVEFYIALGHRAKRTGATGDHGVDVVVHTSEGEKWVVQCKRWRGTVGEPIVRDFLGVIQHEKADKGAIITTGKFSAQAREWVKGKPLTLIEGDQFLVTLKRARGTSSQLPVVPESSQNPEIPTASPQCPQCGKQMILRTAKKGVNQGEQFWGCSAFPQCRGTVKYTV